MKFVAIMHAAGYVGRALIESVLNHPELLLKQVTSQSQEGLAVSAVHPRLRGFVDLEFKATVSGSESLDVIFVAAAHGQGAKAVGDLRDRGFGGLIVDMSADFRLQDVRTYEERYGLEHPRPDLLAEAWYGMPEITGPPPPGTHLIANPGCFATALSLALYPLSAVKLGSPVCVTALTGASGSGARPQPGTHFPNRSGNVRAYKVLSHQHEAEIRQMVPELNFSFVPVSGPWTAGIWGNAQMQFPLENADDLYGNAYSSHDLIRLWPGKLPEMHYSVGSPFTDIGWVQKGTTLVVGFGLDNLMKGAATQAIQNTNLVFGFPESLGLLPATTAG